MGKMGQMCAGGRKPEFSPALPTGSYYSTEAEIGLNPWPTQYAEIVMETAVLYEHNRYPTAGDFAGARARGDAESVLFMLEIMVVNRDEVLMELFKENAQTIKNTVDFTRLVHLAAMQTQMGGDTFLLFFSGHRTKWSRAVLHSVLECAVVSNNAPVVRILLKLGKIIDVNYNLPHSGDTLLHVACTYSHSQMVRILLDHGADCEAKNRHNVSAKETADQIFASRKAITQSELDYRDVRAETAYSERHIGLKKVIWKHPSWGNASEKDTEAKAISDLLHKHSEEQQHQPAAALGPSPPPPAATEAEKAPPTETETIETSKDEE